MALPPSLGLPLAEAQAQLAAGEEHVAESRFRTALYEGWLLLGTLDAVDGRLSAAAEAFGEAGRVSVEQRRAITSLAVVRMHQGRADESVRLLLDLLSRNPGDLSLRRLMAQALVVAGKPEQAVQELADAHARNPDDLELAFALGTGYLRLGEVEKGESILDTIAAARPLPQTHVLLGRTYRDFGQYERARAELEKALELDPQVPRARYYLGTVDVLSEGRLRLEEAIAQFRAEIEGGIDDASVQLYLGMALAEARRFEEALGPLRIAARAEPPPADAHHFLGRSLLGLDRPEEAIAELERALELAAIQGAEKNQLSSIHYQLGSALRRLDRSEEAETQFAAARQELAELTEVSRARLRDYLGKDDDGEAADRYLEQKVSAEATEPSAAAAFSLPDLEAVGLSDLEATDRQALRSTLLSALARSYLNLGILLVRDQHHARAGDLISRAAQLEPDLPRVWYSLGVARFNAGQFEEAAGPLEKAVREAPEDPTPKRMLALSRLNLEQYAEAAELLVDDPRRAEDPALEYAYALALVRSGRAADATPVFDRLLQGHQRWPELHVLLGQAHAQDGNYPAARQALERAIELEPTVAEANGTLGVLLLRQGEMAGAEAALRAELEHRPDDLRSRYHLAVVLEIEDQLEEASAALRAVLDAEPSHADARYLLGKIHLRQDRTEAAIAQLEAAAALAPDDSNIFNQLGRAYQQAGQPDRAREAFERFRALKDSQRDGAGS